MSLLITNYSHVAKSTYIVRTQAGFRKALKHRFEDWKSLEVLGPPRSYPSLVTLDCNDQGMVNCNAIHLNVIKEAIRCSEANANFQPQMG